MTESFYWLVSITSESLSVALIKQGQTPLPVAIGPETEWSTDDPESFLRSVDVSLSAAADKATLSPEAEPADTAFIVPPLWIGSDGKIAANYLKLLENLCRSLKLKPMGFISNDEAFVEALGKTDSFPPSFILLHLGKKEYSVSLVYLGEVKKRLTQALTADFTPQDLENTLLTIQTDSALPPRILVFGNIGDAIIEDLKNYPWIGKKNIETFLHLPDVEAYPTPDLFALYTRSINTQPDDTPAPPPVVEENPSEDTTPVIEEESNLSIPETEVAPADLGFTVPQAEATPAPSPKKINLPKFSFKKIKLPKLSFNPLFLLPLALTPLILLLPYLLTRAEVVMNFNPVEINREVNITLDSNADTLSSKVIPAHKKTLNLNFSDSLDTTGQKETGDKSKGQITVLNQSDKIQNVPKGSLLLHESGKQYELLTSAQVPPSTIDFGTGTITMGQAKADIIATDIGSDYDLSQDARLSFKENSNLHAKTSSPVTGGSKRQVQVVSETDKANLNKRVTDSLDERIDEKIKAEASLEGVLPGTLFIDKKQLDFNREVGEEADQLQVDATLTLSLLQVDPSKNEEIINTLLKDDQAFLNSIASVKDFSFAFTPTQNTSQKSTGKLTITGKSLPKLNLDPLRQRLTKQKVSDAGKIIESQPQVYNYEIKILPSVFNIWQRLPLSPEKITIIQQF